MKRYRSEASGHVERAAWHIEPARQTLCEPMSGEVAAIAAIAVLDARIEIDHAMAALAEADDSAPNPD